MAVFSFTETDYLKAFDVGRGESYQCDSLSEVIAYVIGLLDTLEPPERPRQERDSHPAVLFERMRLDTIEKSMASACLRSPYAWWFRGSDGEHPLVSGVFREDLRELNYPMHLSNYEMLDRRLRHEYFLLVRRDKSEISSSVWDRVFEMQHYGMPTRLLDWSMNLTTAVFFAVESAFKKQSAGEDVSPTIWMLNPRILSGVFLGEYALNDYAYLEMHGQKEELGGWTKIPSIQTAWKTSVGRPNWIYDTLIESTGHFPVLPSWTNSRLLAQAGAFTLQASKLPLDDVQREVSQRFLLKVRLNSEAVPVAERQLQRIGIERRSLFRESEHIARSIIQNRGLKKHRK
jgi:hypothetical protein